MEHVNCILAIIRNFANSLLTFFYQQKYCDYIHITYMNAFANYIFSRLWKLQQAALPIPENCTWSKYNHHSRSSQFGKPPEHEGHQVASTAQKQSSMCPKTLRESSTLAVASSFLMHNTFWLLSRLLRLIRDNKQVFGWCSMESRGSSNFQLGTGSQIPHSNTDTYRPQWRHNIQTTIVDSTMVITGI